MAARIIIEERDGSVQVSLQREGVTVPEATGEAIPFDSPFSPDELEDLRWYLEEYLVAPYAVWEERGATIHERLTEWGQRLFACVFGAGKPGRDAYMEVRDHQPELRIVSSSPAFLSLPWEAMCDPDLPAPLATTLACINRTVNAATTPNPVSRDENLHVLMVIARPYGLGDVPYQMIARPLLERLGAVSGRVELAVLRPPTVDALTEVLAAANDAGRPFDVLHFDGHGMFGQAGGAGGGANPNMYAAPEGFLVFEDASGNSDTVSGGDFAALLNEADVPLLVLNACQSGMMHDGVGPEAAVASRLLQEGAAAVVAMSHSVYAVAAAEFMTVFYQTLFAGKSVAEAVTAGRVRMHRKNLRPSPKGPMPLHDWIVPVHYTRGEVSFPQLATQTQATEAALDETLDRIRAAGEQQTDNDPFAAVGSFVGRDSEFYLLEKALPAKHVVILHGVGGTGKTELAKAFARWLVVSGGLDDPRLAFFHSFEPGLATFGVDGLVTSLGLAVFGPNFVRQFGTSESRRQAVVQLFAKHRCLLVLDNFETVCSMPDPTGATPPLEGEALQAIRDFLHVLAEKARLGVLITTRSPEDWLGKEIHRISVGGLKPHDAGAYADTLLAALPDAQLRRQNRAYGELIEYLAGHPLSLRLILPHLATTDAAALLAGLKGQGDLPPGFESAPGRLDSLGASVHYSFQHLGEHHQRRLPALVLFEGVADVNALMLLSKQEGVPDRFAGADGEAWGETLDACAEAGLVSRTEVSNAYQMHPALPGYLAALWKHQAGETFDAEQEAARLANIHAHAELGTWLNKQIEAGSAETAMAVLHLEKRTFGTVAGQALQRGMFDPCQGMLMPLVEYWEARGLFDELRAWTDRCRTATEDASGIPAALDTPSGALWLFMVGAEANSAMDAGDLDGAETAHDSIRQTLESMEGESARRDLATSYHQLGNVAYLRGDHASAEPWYRKSLEIHELLRDRPRMAGSYHQLGMVAGRRGDYDSAESWYRKALEIEESLGDRPHMAASYHQLGIVAEDRGDYDSAEAWYRKSLEIYELLRDRPGMAAGYHQLGVVAGERGNYDSAEAWYRKSLEIKESLGEHPGMASTYHQLGNVAYLRGNYDSAESWYRKSLEIEESLGNRPGMATSYGQLGLLAEKRENAKEALDWTVRCVSLFSEFPHPATKPGPKHLARLTAELGMDALADSWQRCTGQALPDNVRKGVEAMGKNPDDQA